MTQVPAVATRPEAAPPEVAAVRAAAREVAAAQARELRAVAGLAVWCEREARALLAAAPRVPGQPSDTEVVVGAVATEVSAALGISRGQAGRLVELASRLTETVPRVLGALEEGRLDLPRARVLAEATAVLDDGTARLVADQMLADCGDRGEQDFDDPPSDVADTGGPGAPGGCSWGPWDGPAPRAWRSHVARAVVAADLDAARRRRELAMAERAVRVWPEPDGIGVLQVRAGAEDIAMAERVVNGLALAWPGTDAEGNRLGMDQRRADALMDLFRRVHAGRGLPGDPRPAPAQEGRAERPVGRDREIGLVLHADTLFGDGPAARALGQLRGLGAEIPLDPDTARRDAGRAIAIGTQVRVLLVDETGALAATVKLGATPDGGWTRALLTAAARDGLDSAPPLVSPAYAPTAAIIAHVQARNPRCTGYDCPRAARRCDLDHDVPWPRGPTSADNLHPRCRRDHELKTRGLITTSLHADGSVSTTTLTGLEVVTRPDALPGTMLGQ